MASAAYHIARLLSVCTVTMDTPPAENRFIDLERRTTIMPRGPIKVRPRADTT